MDERGRGKQKEDESCSRHLHGKHLGTLSIRAAVLIDFSPLFDFTLRPTPFSSKTGPDANIMLLLSFFSPFMPHIRYNGDCHISRPQTDTK